VATSCVETNAKLIDERASNFGSPLLGLSNRNLFKHFRMCSELTGSMIVVFGRH
jgi:hypothetical protein